jgi:hypothetical protein
VNVVRLPIPYWPAVHRELTKLHKDDAALTAPPLS